MALVRKAKQPCPPLQALPKKVNPMTNPIYGIYGASGCGRGFMPIARELLKSKGIPLSRLVFIDDGELKQEVNGHRVLTFDDFMNFEATDRYVSLSVADGRLRKTLEN